MLTATEKNLPTMFWARLSVLNLDTPMERDSHISQYMYPIPYGDALGSLQDKAIRTVIVSPKI